MLTPSVGYLNGNAGYYCNAIDFHVSHAPVQMNYAIMGHAIGTSDAEISISAEVFMCVRRPAMHREAPSAGIDCCTQTYMMAQALLTSLAP